MERSRGRWGTFVKLDKIDVDRPIETSQSTDATQFSLHAERGQLGTARAVGAAAPCFRLATGPRSAPPAAESRGHSPPHQRRARQGRQHSQGESQAKPRSVRRRFGGCRRRCRRGVPGHGAWRVRPAAWPGLLRGPSRDLAGWGKPPWAQPSRLPGRQLRRRTGSKCS